MRDIREFEPLWGEWRSVRLLGQGSYGKVYLAEKVLILTNKPAKIKEEVYIDLPRPRDITSPKFIEYRNYITDKIKWW